MDAGTAIIVTCEHGGKRIPPRYRRYFTGQEDLLNSHRGYDAGALTLARALAQALDAPLHYGTVSRLLVDLNRSPGHPRLHAECIRRLPAAERQEIVARHYLPFRRAVTAAVAAAVGRGRRVIHLSSHSFTPQLDGVVRRAAVGLLYDPARAGEADLCRRWRSGLIALAPELAVRRNYPYAGKSDGLTASLRRRFPATAYVGIELEVNQGIVRAGGQAWRRLRTAVIASLLQALGRPPRTAAPIATLCSAAHSETHR